MKVFISADMEGLTTTTSFDDCMPSGKYYDFHTRQMTAEVAAACEGAINAGAGEIVIKDAHEEADNIDATGLPACSKLIKNWSGHPYGMAEGIDTSFDACMFIGYHSGAGSGRSPMAHTVSRRAQAVIINGSLASEFTIYGYVAALEGVPVVFLAGDKGICEEAESVLPHITTVAVKDGSGSATTSLQPGYACELIRAGAEAALRSDLSRNLITLPDHFEVEVTYHNHFDAEAMSYFPGVRKSAARSISFESDNYFEVKRILSFAL